MIYLKAVIVTLTGEVKIPQRLKDRLDHYSGRVNTVQIARIPQHDDTTTSDNTRGAMYRSKSTSLLYFTNFENQLLLNLNKGFVQ